MDDQLLKPKQFGEALVRKASYISGFTIELASYRRYSPKYYEYTFTQNVDDITLCKGLAISRRGMSPKVVESYGEKLGNSFVYGYEQHKKDKEKKPIDNSCYTGNNRRVRYGEKA